MERHDGLPSKRLNIQESREKDDEYTQGDDHKRMRPCR